MDFPVLMDMPDDGNSTDASSSFCSGGMGGMIMYMDGFKFSLSGGDHEQPCLNLFFADWTLDTKAKFYAALVGVFILAVAVEAISTFRYRIVHSVKKTHRRVAAAAASSSATDASTSRRPSHRSTQALRLFVTILHGLQGLLGYLLMLATMTFSVELFMSVVLGLAVGYGIFFQYEEALGRLHVTSNPCCSFLEGEARETQTQQEEEEVVMRRESQPPEQPDNDTTSGSSGANQQERNGETEQTQTTENA